MIEAGRVKHLAEDLIKMVCFLCVVVDGGWSKRSHKHLCNANPRVGIIVKGNCSTLACGTNSALLAFPRKHLTFKYWNASSSEMEVEIIVEGFIEAESITPNLLVMGTVLSTLPLLSEYQVGVMQSANLNVYTIVASVIRAHQKLVQNNPSYKHNGDLTDKMRRRSVSAARCAVDT